jgi:hypothetical protein
MFGIWLMERMMLLKPRPVSMFILQGNCTKLQCIASAFSITELSCATVRFQSVVGESYHILYQAKPELGNGKFSLSVNTISVETLGNDLCYHAEQIEPNPNTIIFGSTTVAIQEFYDDACSGISSSRDLWYQVLGKGVGMLASLCNPETDFMTRLSIYSSLRGDGSCSDLECVATKDVSCAVGVAASQVWWLTEQNRVYLIRVHGFEDSAGNFALILREQVDEPLDEEDIDVL